jgi:hypothetical protein
MFAYATFRQPYYSENAVIFIRQLSVHASRGRENMKRVNTRQINMAHAEEE